MARHFWPNEDPIGGRLKTIFLPDITLEVVGVVKDVKLQGLDVSSPVQAMYLPFAQFPNPYMSLVMRTTPPPTSLISAMTQVVHDADREQPLVAIRTMDEVMSGSIARQRFTMLLLATFAALALLLAAVGIYSVLSYAVRQRVREIGIRLALGAQPGEVVRMIVLYGMRLTLVGVAIGLVGATALSRLLSTFFYGVSGTDPLTFAGVSALVVAVGFSASVIPAYRATTVDPITTLREE